MARVCHLQSETITSDPAGNKWAETYTYDAVGNRKTLASTIPSLPGSISYTPDANDRLSTDTYDNNGNTTISLGVTSHCAVPAYCAGGCLACTSS